MPADQTISPCALVIFGASGDLTRRKLMPAVYNLARSRLLPGVFAVVGVARRVLPDFGEEMKRNVARFSRRKPLDETTWAELARGISYVAGGLRDGRDHVRPAEGANSRRSTGSAARRGAASFTCPSGPT